MEDKDFIFEDNSEEPLKRSISEEFEEERKKWKEKVLDMANRVNKLDQVASLQVDLYSSRQIIIERISKLYQYLSLYNSVYKSKRKELFIKYTVDSDIKLGQGEKNIMVDGDLAELNNKINLIEHHIDYYKETVKNLDSMLYGVRNKLQIEQFLSGK
jgi:chromosome segregation ATPase